MTCALGRSRTAALVAIGVTLVALAAPSRASGAAPARHRYRWHRHVVSTTFWVGEIFRPGAPDGSQVISTYDSHWWRHYGGCDGVVRHGKCHTERRFRRNGWFPRHMTPKQNPFYLDVPYDDVNNRRGFHDRCSVVPWASRPAFRHHCTDRNFSYLKNRWVQIIGPNGHSCYGQVEDAGPGDYHDSAYVFGPARPSNRRYNHAGMDVSPALNGCLGFAALDGDHDHVSWRFVDRMVVPHGPWLRKITRSPIDE